MRELNIGTKRHTTVFATDEPGQGNANHEYHIKWDPDNNGYIACQSIKFQNGPIKEVGVNGIHNEDLLVIVMDRLKGFQSGEYACEENSEAYVLLSNALAAIRKRTDRREKAGIEGTSAKDARFEGEPGIIPKQTHDPEHKKHVSTKPHNPESPAPALRNAYPMAVRKPVKLGFHQWQGENHSFEFPTWLNEALAKGRDTNITVCQGGARIAVWGDNKPRMELGTLTGVVTAEVGDFIMLGVIGEIYPCKPDIFEATYNIVLDGRND